MAEITASSSRSSCPAQAARKPSPNGLLLLRCIDLVVVERSRPSLGSRATTGSGELTPRLIPFGRFRTYRTRRKSGAMPKVSKESAQIEDHGPVEDRHEDVDGYTASFVLFREDIDATPLLKGAPDD